MTPISALRRQVEQQPEGTAFIAGEEAWTYRRLAEEVGRLAQAMLAQGVRPGDRVALHMFNLPELVVAYHACFRIGAIAAPLNARFKTAELRPLLARLRPALYLGQAQLYSQVEGIEADILPPAVRYVVDADGGHATAQVWEDLLENAEIMPLRGEPDTRQPAVLLTTSGTTGVPKLVAHTPATLSAVLDACIRFGLEGKHVVVNPMPMMHASGLVVTLCAIHYGEPMVLLERFDADAVLDAIETHQGSWLLGMPYIYPELLRAQRARPRDVGSLRLCLTGGDAISQRVQEEFSELFETDLLNIWGASEVIGALYHGEEFGPVARVAPDAQIRLVDDEGVPVPRGEVGELLVRGPYLAVGYWRGPGEFDPLAPDGWYHTGDLMRQGEDGEIWFVARKKDLIIRGGSNISPLEVERVLMAHPAVRDAAVVGIPDEALGQRVAAVVELKSKVSRDVLDDILSRTRKQLADYKVPERLTVVRDIPRNTLGKVDRKALATVLSEVQLEESAVPL